MSHCSLATYPRDGVPPFMESSIRTCLPFCSFILPDLYAVEVVLAHCLLTWDTEMRLGFILEMEVTKSIQTALVLPENLPARVVVNASLWGWKHLHSPLLGFGSPFHVLSHLCEDPHHCAVKALAGNPTQISKYMIFRLRLGPLCISELEPEVIPHT